MASRFAPLHPRPANAYAVLGAKLGGRAAGRRTHSRAALHPLLGHADYGIDVPRAVLRAPVRTRYPGKRLALRTFTSPPMLNPPPASPHPLSSHRQLTHWDWTAFLVPLSHVLVESSWSWASPPYCVHCALSLSFFLVCVSTPSLASFITLTLFLHSHSPSLISTCTMF